MLDETTKRQLKQAGSLLLVTTLLVSGIWWSPAANLFVGCCFIVLVGGVLLFTAVSIDPDGYLQRLKEKSNGRIRPRPAVRKIHRVVDAGLVIAATALGWFWSAAFLVAGWALNEASKQILEEHKQNNDKK